MNTMLRKVIAGAGVTAVLAMQFASFVSAAGLNGTTDLTVVPGATSFAITNINATSPFTAGAGQADVKVKTGTGDVWTQIPAATFLASSATDAVVDLGVTAVDSNATYSISFTDANGVYGAVVVNTGTANQIVVTARVAPILTLAIDESLFAFGTLNTAAYATGATSVHLVTNAEDGAVVTVSSNGLVDTATSKAIGFTGGLTGIADTTANAPLFYSYAVGTGADAAAVKADAVANLGTNAMAKSLSAVIATVGSQNITKGFAIGAKIDAQTEAGNYSDTLTFSATANF